MTGCEYFSDSKFVGSGYQHVFSGWVLKSYWSTQLSLTPTKVSVSRSENNFDGNTAGRYETEMKYGHCGWKGFIYGMERILISILGLKKLAILLWHSVHEYYGKSWTHLEHVCEHHRWSAYRDNWEKSPLWQAIS